MGAAKVNILFDRLLAKEPGNASADRCAVMWTRLLETLTTTAPPKNREEQAARARARWKARN